MPISIIIPGMSPGKGGGKDPVLEKLEVTENGTYTPGSGIDGYNEVAVDVDLALQLKVINENGEYYPDEGYNGFEAVAVDVQPALESLTVTENGSYQPEEGVYGFDHVDVSVVPLLEPITITENGTYLPETSDGFEEVVVDVQPELEPITITENGTYLPEADGFSEVEVDVPSPQLDEITITENGTYYPENYGFYQVNVEVPQEGTDYVAEKLKGTLTSYNIPSDITLIANYGFAYFKDLSSVTFPSQLTSIGLYAFLQCDSLSQLSIPNTVTYIGLYAFAECGLTDFSWPSSVTEIRNNTFESCSMLSQIYIPSTVSTFGDRVFLLCTNLSSVIFESGISIYKLGHEMFNQCTALYSISIPDGYTGEHDSSNVFSESFLHTITLPSTTTHIASWALHLARSLETLTVYASVPPILGGGLLTDNPLMSDIRVPYESIDDYKSANYWSEWSSIIKPISIPSGVSCNLNFNFLDCELVSPVSQYTLGDSLDIEIITTVSGYSVPETISIDGSDDYEYSVSGNIGTLTINHATDIDIMITGIAGMPLPEGFEDYESIPYIEVGNIYGDGLCAYRIKRFDTGVLPNDTDTYEIIDAGRRGYQLCLAGNNGWNFDNFLLGYFDNCSNLRWSSENNIAENLLLLNVIKFGKNTFNLNGNDITLESDVTYDNYDNSIIIGNADSSNVTCDCDGVYKFARFKVTNSNDEVTHFIVPARDKYGIDCLIDVITEEIIYSKGYDRVSGWQYASSDILSAIFPNVGTIETGGFASCSMLSEAAFPGCTLLGQSAFYDCSSLKYASFYNVSTIEDRAFYNCYNLSEIYAPNCKSIRSSVFYSCSSLTSANLPVCLSIGQLAFAYCSALTAVNLPVCTNIGTSAFRNCSSLTSANLPVCLSIGQLAFAYCSALTAVNLPACKSIGFMAFHKCNALKSINLPVCTYIDTSAFLSCFALTSIDLPSCTQIGDHAFVNCSSLTSVNLPVCTYIFRSAFLSCISLSQVILESTIVCELINTQVFTSTPMSNSSYLGYYGSIYVPASLVDAYKTANNWSVYSDRITAIV